MQEGILKISEREKNEHRYAVELVKVQSGSVMNKDRTKPTSSQTRSKRGWCRVSPIL